MWKRRAAQLWPLWEAMKSFHTILWANITLIILPDFEGLRVSWGAYSAEGIVHEGKKRVQSLSSPCLMWSNQENKQTLLVHPAWPWHSPDRVLALGELLKTSSDAWLQSERWQQHSSQQPIMSAFHITLEKSLEGGRSGCLAGRHLNFRPLSLVEWEANWDRWRVQKCETTRQ